MKITEIREEVKHHVHTEEDHYIRYGPDDWVRRMYFDIISDDTGVSEETAKELEALFQVEMELEELIDMELKGLIKTEIQ